VDGIAFLLGPTLPAVALDSPERCFEMLEALDESRGLRCASRFSIDRATMGGFCADRLGYAFLAGYRAALLAIDASLTRASLCATEEGGAHPRAIETRLVRVEDDGASRTGAYRLDGRKTFATLASVADTLLVVASVGRNATRNDLRVVRVPARRAGIAMNVRPPLPFTPEIPHAEITFRDVQIEPGEVLEGDGYTHVLKPFRTMEDMHVTAAWLAYLVRLARSAGARDVVARAVASVAALRSLSERDPSAADTHVALAGVLAQAATLLDDWNPDGCDEMTRERWRRDRPLLDVARNVRNLRREAAWAQIDSIRPPGA
jgi:hypothetical protein